MKQHRMAALAAAAALAITSTVIAVPVQAAPEELMNSTFEDGYGAWKGVGSTISITSDYAHSGDSSLLLVRRCRTGTDLYFFCLCYVCRWERLSKHGIEAALH